MQIQAVAAKETVASDDKTVYAHTLAGRPRSAWETLGAHAANVARLAGEFAGAFGAAEWGVVLGRWHDLGKRSEAFQQYLRQTADPSAGEDEHAPERVDHSTFGAQYAARMIGGHAGQLLAFCIAGHHGGLADAAGGDELTRASTLQARLKKKVPEVVVPARQTQPPKLKLPFIPTRGLLGFQVAFFTRMLFSTLVDADRTATEQFCDPGQAAARLRPKPALADLAGALESFLEQLQSGAPPTPVNRVRSRVLADCRSAAPEPPGFFSLNVPTGGGKTYASLAFALEHARAHAASHVFRRVIVAIPFTSIIEQTADAYRRALRPLAEGGLIEHHSNVDPKNDTRRNKLAAENWDAPLVVTTNVQLYESLFAAATSPCRKLHRITKSIIVLDEAQTIPVELLHPTLLALRELVANYGCTVVLCTATQPALERRDGEFEIGIENVRPIVRDVPHLFSVLRRVRFERLGKVSDAELVQRIAAERAALCVVNTRRHAALLHGALVARCGRDGCYHLSTLMCAQHRREKLEEVRDRLRRGEPCRLISTQLIEAGVDVDFPAVYRAPAGFDSIAQAAGRCNREGLLRVNGRSVPGRVYLFETATPPPPGLQRAAAQSAQELIDRHPDPLSPDAVEEYFRLLYWTQKHNRGGGEVLSALADDLQRPDLRIQFKTAARLYQLIGNEQTPILVPFDRAARRIRDVLARGDGVDFLVLRAAQRYLVPVHDHRLAKMMENRLICQHESGLWWLTSDEAYSLETGMSFGAAGHDPASFVDRQDDHVIRHQAALPGELACFTRPEMKVERVSYDVITPSAARGILEAIYWKPQIHWVIDRLRVLNPIRFTSLRRNEVGAKIGARTAEAAMRAGRGCLGFYVEDERQQRASLLLRDVAYVIEAYFRIVAGEINRGKHLDQIYRRARDGRCHTRPYLGCREFASDFELVEHGQPPPPVHPSLSGRRDLGWMLHDIDFKSGRRPRFFHAIMNDGVINVPPFDSPEAGR